MCVYECCVFQAGSGVAIDDAVPLAVKDVQLNKKHRYVILRLTDDLTKVIVEKKAERGKSTRIHMLYDLLIGASSTWKWCIHIHIW